MDKITQLKKQMENNTLLVWKMAIGSALSWELAKLAGSTHPYLAPISVILCLQKTVDRAIRFSYHRLAGTVIGILVTVLAAPYFVVNSWNLGLLILAGGFIAKWLKQDETALHQAALTVLLVFVLDHKGGNYPIDRFRDTLIGALVAVLIHMIAYPPNFTKQAVKSFQLFEVHIIVSFKKVAKWIQSGLDSSEGQLLQTEVKRLLEELHQTKDFLTDASHSLEYNPFGKKSREEIKKYEQQIYFLDLGYTYLSSIMDSFIAWSNAGTITPIQIAVWTDQLKSLSTFLESENNLTELKQPGKLMKVSISSEFEKQMYQISLYNETVLFLNKMNEWPRNRS